MREKEPRKIRENVLGGDRKMREKCATESRFSGSAKSFSSSSSMDSPFDLKIRVNPAASDRRIRSSASFSIGPLFSADS